MNTGARPAYGVGVDETQVKETDVNDEAVRSAPRRIRPPQVPKPARKARLPETQDTAPEAPPQTPPPTPQQRLAEIRRGYRQGPEDDGIDPTRFGDWEYGGRCTDF